MNKILLDFGANKGQGLTKVLDIEGIDKTWEIHCFEANPNIFEELKNNFKNANLNIFFHNKAIWKIDGLVQFSIMNENDEGSSVECLIKEGRAGDPCDPCFRKHDNIIQIESIDIQTILDRFNENDFIVIKMDIEGSEFTVLRRLLENKNNCRKVKKIYIEWHTNYVKNESETTQNDICFKLANYGIQTYNNW